MPPPVAASSSQVEWWLYPAPRPEAREQDRGQVSREQISRKPPCLGPHHSNPSNATVSTLRHTRDEFERLLRSPPCALPHRRRDVAAVDSQNRTGCLAGEGQGHECIG